eukprot:s1597_g7.t1
MFKSDPKTSESIRKSVFFSSPGFESIASPAAVWASSAKDGGPMVCQKVSSAHGLHSCHVSGHRCHWRNRPANRPRRDSPADRSLALEAAEKWLKEAQAACAVVISPSTSSFLQLQSLLKHLNAADEASVQIWCEHLGSAKLCDLEGQLRQKAIDIFEVVKFDLAQPNPQLGGNKGTRSNPLRADLLRPSFGSVSCTEIWETLSDGNLSEATAGSTSTSTADASPVLAKLSGCAEDDAARLIRFGRRLSELFAPIELTKHLARQDWTKVPYASGAALLPALDRVVRELQMSGTGDVKVKVAIFGSSGCQLAAAAHRLGCESSLAEPRPLLRACLQRLFEHNQVTCCLGEGADPTADVFVLALDEDGLVEWGQLQLLRRHLQRKASRKAPGMPQLIPDRILIKAALIDDTLPRIRGCPLNRFERMRGFDLQVSHRWPKGACHIHPQFRSNSQVIYDLALSDFVASSDLTLDRAHLSFLPEPGVISGVAYWVTVPGLPEEFDKAWIRCIQPLPVRRVEVGSKNLHLWANFSEVKLWFDWADDGGETTVMPPLGKTKLPPWHFKMLNDHQRNRGYHQALARAVQRKTGRSGAVRLLDCGCGAGLLSLLASREGGPSLEITAVELSPLISDITQEVFGASSSLKLVTGDVRALRPEQVGRYDIIVSELMDASGLGESLLSVLEHACSELASPGAQVIPCGLRLIGALGWLTLPNCHGSFDFSTLDSLNFCSRRGGPFSKENPPSCLHVGHDVPSLHSGPFTSRNLNRLRRGEAWDLLTEEETLLTVDFREAFLRDLRQSRVQPSVVHGTRCLTRCGRGQGAWQMSLEVAAWMRLEGIQLDNICWNALVSCCGHGNQWQAALRYPKTDSRGASALISACRDGFWKAAQEILGSITWGSIRVDLVTSNAAVSAMDKGKRWEKALLLFDVLKRQKIFDSFTFTSTISSCALETWHRARAVLMEMTWNRVPCNVKTLNAQVSCDLSGQRLWQGSLCLVETICRSSLRVDEDTLNAVISCCCGQAKDLMESGDFWRIAMHQLFSWWQTGADVRFPVSFSSLLRACVECNQWCVAADLFQTSMYSKQFLYPSSFNAAITLAPDLLGWQVAFHVLERMKNGRLLPNEITWNSILAVCEKSFAWESALDAVKNVAASVMEGRSFDAILSASSKTSSWRMATSMEQVEFRVLPDVVSYHLLMAISTWSNAIALLHNMQLFGLEAVGDSYNILLGLQDDWFRALAQVEQMPWKGLEVDVVAFNSTLKVCQGQWMRCCDFAGRLGRPGNWFGSVASCEMADVPQVTGRLRVSFGFWGSRSTLAALRRVLPKARCLQHLRTETMVSGLLMAWFLVPVLAEESCLIQVESHGQKASSRSSSPGEYSYQQTETVRNLIKEPEIGKGLRGSRGVP